MAIKKNLKTKKIASYNDQSRQAEVAEVDPNPYLLRLVYFGA